MDALAPEVEGFGRAGFPVTPAKARKLITLGQFFLKHQDTEETDDMIGTLVVTLLSSYSGGELMTGRGEERKAYRGSRNARSLPPAGSSPSWPAI